MEVFVCFCRNGMLNWFVIYHYYLFSVGLVLVCGSMVTPAGA